MVLTYFTHNINFENNRKPRPFEQRFSIGISLIFKSFTSDKVQTRKLAHALSGLRTL